MSITFYCYEAPRTRKPCPFCQEAVERGYDVNGRCDHICDGTMESSEAPECNFANTNALNILNLLGIEPDYCGSWKPSELGNIQQRILRVINSDRRRQPLVEDAFTSPNGRYIYCGNTDEQTVRRLSYLRELVSYAQKHNFEISWS